jgi:hypothetical protein
MNGLMPGRSQLHEETASVDGAPACTSARPTTGQPMSRAKASPASERKVSAERAAKGSGRVFMTMK